MCICIVKKTKNMNLILFFTSFYGCDACSCGYSQSGNLLSAQNVVDGIMGFGQSKLSVISQLYMQGLIPRVFAHCLQGSEKGGGILVIGNVVDHGFPFTPIISSE